MSHDEELIFSRQAFLCPSIVEKNGGLKFTRSPLYTYFDLYFFPGKDAYSLSCNLPLPSGNFTACLIRDGYLYNDSVIAPE